MFKETLSHYGWIVITIICALILIMLATPFGKYVGTVGTNLSNSFQNVDINSRKENVEKDMNEVFLGDSTYDKQVSISGQNSQ